MKTRNQGNFLGLTPMLLFVSLVVITGLLANDFGAMPILVAFMISAGYALTLNPREHKISVGQKVDIFCAGGGEKMAKQYDVDMLGNLPLDIKIREGADSGQPTVVSDPDGDITLSYRTIAHRITAHLAKQGKDYSGAFPNIVIKND